MKRFAPTRFRKTKTSSVARPSKPQKLFTGVQPVALSFVKWGRPVGPYQGVLWDVYWDSLSLDFSTVTGKLVAQSPVPFGANPWFTYNPQTGKLFKELSQDHYADLARLALPVIKTMPSAEPEVVWHRIYTEAMGELERV
jgi:hypothetical protein